jgi:transcriptional regulator with XRE-family HTH domain
VTLVWHEGDVVRKLRTLTGWTLQQTAARSGVTFNTISRIELGVTQEAKRGTLTKVAAAFGLTARQLADCVPPPGDIPIEIPERARAAAPAPKRSGRARSRKRA